MKIYTKLLAGFLAAGVGVSTILSANAAISADTAAVVNRERSAEQAITNMLALGEYAEGEAVAVIKGDSAPSSFVDTAETELLVNADIEAVKSAVEVQKEMDPLTAELASQRLQECGEGVFSIWKISDHGKTTEQLLQELYSESEVIAAEPNYMVYAAEAEAEEAQQGAAAEGSSQGATADMEHAPEEEPAKPVPDTPSVNDLSAMQWDLAGTDDIYTTPLSPTGGYNLGIPGWKEGRRNENAPANSTGTICIMDTGIDTDHPDLQGVLYEFTEEQQQKYGCGKYGYNASGDGRPLNEQKAVESHGTHVAGIIAANWNGEGVSGIAHGAKIFSVNVFGGNGSVQVMEDVLKGFRFLIDVAQEVNLKAVNCSWGTVQPQFAFNVVIEELGRKGVNTVIASGNRYFDLDEGIDLGSQSRSEYAVVVNSSAVNGAITDFSCWGQDSTDVFAPGGAILSTVPQIIQIGEDENPDVYMDNTRFYPEASKAESLLSGLEKFDSEKPGVLFFASNPAIDPKARSVGEISKESGFDDKRSMALRLSELPKEEQKEHGGFSAVNGYVYMAIPVTSAQDARWISVKTAMSDEFKPSGGIDSVVCKGADGNPVEIDCACASALMKGYGSGAFYTIYKCQWTELSYNIQGYIGASNEAHSLLQQDMTEEERNELLYRGFADYSDPGEITGLYEWEKDGQSYVIARVGIGMLAGASLQTEITEQTALYIDNVAVGDENAFTGAYAIMSGTSMAAPAVTGCLAVIAKDEPQSASMTQEQLAEAARERAAKLMACVDYDDTLASLCRTGGRVNLHEQTEFNVKAPLISGAAVQEGKLTVEGWYFGTEGTIAVDDKVIGAQSWEDGKILADVSGLPNGSHVVRITNADGKVSRAVFSSSAENAEGRRLFENTLSLPLEEPVFVQNDNDRLYSSIAAGGGKIYTFAASAKYKNLQGIWSYDIAEDKWSPCAVPEELEQGTMCNFNQMAVLNDRLYMCGTSFHEDENGDIIEEQSLWRYEPYGDFWEKLDIAMPGGSAGICVLGDTLFAVGGVLPGEEETVEEGCITFYKIDPSGAGTTPVSSDIAPNLDYVNCKIAAGGDRIYIYAPLDFGEDEADVKKLTAGGVLLRAAYDASQNRITTEDLTRALEDALGPDLRTAFDKQNAGDEPSEHFAITGLEDGLAIIGSGTPGEDVHILYDTDSEAVLYDKASSYHKAFDPMAVLYDGKLYVIGYNTTEPDVMYFRSDTVRERAQNPQSVSAEAGSSRHMGIITIALIAGTAVLLTVLHKK